METIEEKLAPKKLKIPIGIATVVNSKEGAVIEALFDPMVRIKDCTDLVSALKQVEGPIDKQAELIVATWFEKLNLIESLERDKYHMVTADLGLIDMPKSYPKNTYPEGSVGHRFYYTFEEI